MAGKRAFVLWSGGVDSTCLIEQLCADPAYELVAAGYVYLANQVDKADSELSAIGRMAALLADKYPAFTWLGTILQVEFHKTNRNLAYRQVPPWILAAVEAIALTVDEIAIGYIRNHHPEEEDVTAHIEDLQRIYAAYRPLMHREMPALTFPLLGLAKRDVMARLDPALRALCVWCEEPKRESAVEAGGDPGFRPCGRCRTCQARARALGG